MKVRSKLADIDFLFGSFEYKRDHLVIHSSAEQPMPTKVYVSPNDLVSAMGKALSNPMVWIYILGFPFFLVRYRRRHKRKAAQREAAEAARRERLNT